MNNTPVTKAQIEQFTSALVSYYAAQIVLSDDEVVAFSNFFEAFLAQDLELLNNLFKAYEKAPEDALLVMATFIQTFGQTVNNMSSYYSESEGLLSLNARTKDPVGKPFSKFKGEESHALRLFLDGRAATGYRNCHDDRLLSASAGSGHSGSVSATEALKQLVRVFLEGIEYRIAAGQEHNFTDFKLSTSTVDGLVAKRQFVKDKRAFEVELAEAKASRNTVSYMYWRWENRAKLARFSL